MLCVCLVLNGNNSSSLRCSCTNNLVTFELWCWGQQQQGWPFTEFKCGKQLEVKFEKQKLYAESWCYIVDTWLVVIKSTFNFEYIKQLYLPVMKRRKKLFQYHTFWSIILSTSLQLSLIVFLTISLIFKTCFSFLFRKPFKSTTSLTKYRTIYMQ